MDVALNINYFLLPALLLMCPALGNLLLGVPGAMPG